MSVDKTKAQAPLFGERTAEALHMHFKGKTVTAGKLIKRDETHTHTHTAGCSLPRTLPTLESATAAAAAVFLIRLTAAAAAGTA